MGIVKRAADIAYTFRFIRMLVLDWKDWDAYKLGIIDEEGKRLMERDDLRTVPQIYFNDELIKGGYTGLKKYLEEQK